jgi:hypothetical protein
LGLSIDAGMLLVQVRPLRYQVRFFVPPMLRYAIILFLLSCVGTAQAQNRDMVRGLLLDAISGAPVPSAHVINFSDSMATISSSEGMFRVPASVGDSIIVSCIGYAPGAIVADRELLDSEVTVLHMKPREYMLAEVEVNPFGTRDQFRQNFMELTVDDGVVDVIGVQRPSRNPRTIPVTEDADEIRKAKYLMSPASFLYGNFSKDAKRRQELHRMQAEDARHDSNRSRYNEKVVARITGYEGDLVWEFMNFCNFSESHVHGMNDYQLTVAILNRQKEFERLGNAPKR